MARRVGLARIALFLERLWPLIVPILALTLGFLAFAFIGGFALSPIWLRIVVVGAFALGLALLLVRFRHLRYPEQAEGRARLDRHSGLAHRPVATTADTLGNAADDATTQALWSIHQARMAEKLASIRVRRPQSDMPERDPAAWRYAALLAAFAALLVAGPDWQGRLLAAFDWQNPPAPEIPPRIDAWIDPPPYTGRAPIFLSKADALGEAPQGPISVPVGSTVVVRVTPPAGMSVETSGGFERKLPAEQPGKEGATETDATKTDATKADAAKTDGRKTMASSASADEAGQSASLDQRFVLKGDGVVTVRSAGRTLQRYALNGVPDRAPTVEFLGLKRASKGDGFVLRYRVEDDYGIAGGTAVFSPLPAPDGKVHRTLGEAPSVALAIPPARGASVEAEVQADLSEHPWAGAKLRLTLNVKDDLGQTGQSVPVEVVIPQRPFADPLAKALVEQRRSIVMDPDDRQKPSIALSALNTEPDQFGMSLGVFTGLEIASRRLKAARTDPQLMDVADWLWSMALEIEDGGLSKAERALRAAQERLREAIERGASPEEIKRLTAELKQAMDRYMREYAQKHRNDRQNAMRDSNAKMLNQDDLRAILDKIEELTRNGQFAEAQRLLEKLNEMMKNLQTAEGGGGAGDGEEQRQGDLDKQADDLDKLTRDEQRLRDRTYREGQDRTRGSGQQGQQQGQSSRQGGQQQGRGQQKGQGQRGQAQNGQGKQAPGQQGPGQQGQGQQGQGQQGQGRGNDALAGEEDGNGTGGGTLENRQQRLREKLGQVQRRLKELGAEGEQGLADADDAMRDSEQALREGRNGQAVESQGRALEGLRRGARGLAQQLEQNGQGRNQAEGSDQPGGSPNAGMQDPLGRDASDRGLAQNGGQNDGRLSLEGTGGGTIEERARAVLDELRRRLGQPARPQLELDYLERLMRGN